MNSCSPLGVAETGSDEASLLDAPELIELLATVSEDVVYSTEFELLESVGVFANELAAAEEKA